MESEPTTCRHCGNSRCLTQRGIVAIYLKPHWWAVAIMLVGVGLALWRGPGWLWLTLLGYLLPLSMADLRLLLYPWVAINALAGRKANCPACEPSGAIFRRS